MLAVTLGIPLGTLQAARAEAGSDTLRAGETLAAGTELRSGRGQYRLVMQGDGNLVMYSQSVTDAVWASGTDGHPGARAVMQGDGNLVVRDKANKALWASGTDGRDGARLVLQNDGNLVIYQGAKSVWAPRIVVDKLASGRTLGQGHELRSGNRKYRLVMQGDGNLVLYSQSSAVWASGTDGHPGARAVMQGDGNLVVRDKANRALWASGTDGRDGASLRIQDDRNLVVYRNGRAVWASGTQVRPSGGGVIGDDYPEPWRSGRLDQYVDTWGNYFAGRGVAVNGTPAVGAIAETSGHVAWVAQVHGDGTVTVEEYNTPAGSGRYAVRRVPRSSFRYIHVKDMC